MGIPLFMPTLELLIDWQMNKWLMKEWTWSGTFGYRPHQSLLPPHPSQRQLPDPNNDVTPSAICYWLKFSDYYHFPHVMYYSSVSDLVRRLQTVTSDELSRISECMMRRNAKDKRQSTEKWTKMLKNITNYSVNHPHY